MDAYIFLKRLRSRYGGKPVYTDRAISTRSMQVARLKYHVYGVEWKNLMERMNQAIKDRSECLGDYFPCGGLTAIGSMSTIGLHSSGSSTTM